MIETTGERQYRVAFRFDGRSRPAYSEPTAILGEAQGDAVKVPGMDAWVEVAEWRRLDCPEPSDAERVEADSGELAARVVRLVSAWDMDALDTLVRSLELDQLYRLMDDFGNGQQFAVLRELRRRKEGGEPFRPPTLAERVEAAHQRMHADSPRIFSFDKEPAVCAEVATGARCRLLALAYAALDVDAPTLTGPMPWRPTDSQTDAEGGVR